MPIYEYVCQDCSLEIEAIQKLSDPPLETHEGCGGKLSKKLSLSSFQLKGNGWYADGYGQKKCDNKTCEKKEVCAAESKPSETKAAS